MRLFQTARRFDMVVQPQLVLLQKTLLNIEGLGRQLYPDLDLWKTAKPFLERWMNEQVGTRAFVKSVGHNVPIWADKMPEIPGLIYDYLKQQQVYGIKVDHHRDQELDMLRDELRRANRRTFRAIAGSTFIISAAIILGMGEYAPLMFGGAPVLTWLLAALGAFVLFFSWPLDKK